LIQTLVVNENKIFLDSRLRENDVTLALIVISAKAGIQMSVQFESEHIFENSYNS